MPYPVYTNEWKSLEENKKHKKFSNLEAAIPIVFGATYIVLLIQNIITFIKLQ